MKSNVIDLTPREKVFGVWVRGRSGARAVFWCEWCETSHFHQDRSSANRLCCADASSPYSRVGRELVVTEESTDPRAGLPDAPFPHGKRPRTLRGALRRGEHDLRRKLAQVIFGKPAPRTSFAVWDLPGDYSVNIEGADWVVRSPRGRGFADRCGVGFIRLATILFGVSAGVAAVRILEAVSGELFDAQAALDIERAVNAFYARGATLGKGRGL